MQSASGYSNVVALAAMACSLAYAAADAATSNRRERTVSRVHRSICRAVSEYGRGALLVSILV
jgi:hypothetical protein